MHSTTPRANLLPSALHQVGMRCHQPRPACFAVFRFRGFCLLALVGKGLSPYSVEQQGSTNPRKFILGLSNREYVLAVVYFWSRAARPPPHHLLILA